MKRSLQCSSDPLQNSGLSEMETLQPKQQRGPKQITNLSLCLRGVTQKDTANLDSSWNSKVNPTSTTKVSPAATKPTTSWAQEKAKQLRMSTRSWKLLLFCTSCLRGKLFSRTSQKVTSAAALRNTFRDVGRLQPGAEILTKLQLRGVGGLTWLFWL